MTTEPEVVMDTQWTEEDDRACQDAADYEAHLYELEQAHWRQLEGEEREREERYADE